jgi:hypothetical protein
MKIRLKIKKSKSGTYYIPSLSIKLMRRHFNPGKRLTWSLSEDGKELILKSE